MKTCSVIIPTLWKGCYLIEMLEKLIESNSVQEIILLDNAPDQAQSIPISEKIIHIQNENNLYVNPSWNLGVRLAKADNLLFLSDDVRFDTWYIPLLLDQLEDGTVIGAHPDAWKENMSFGFAPLPHQVHSWGVMFLMRKTDWVTIPEEMKIWYGDTWLCAHAKRILGYFGIEIETKNETTSSLKQFDSIKRGDVTFWCKSVLRGSDDICNNMVRGFGL